MDEYEAESQENLDRWRTAMNTLDNLLALGARRDLDSKTANRQRLEMRRKNRAIEKQRLINRERVNQE
jgi:hypothetical protein